MDISLWAISSREFYCRSKGPMERDAECTREEMVA